VVDRLDARSVIAIGTEEKSVPSVAREYVHGRTGRNAYKPYDECLGGRHPRRQRGLLWEYQQVQQRGLDGRL
jgi:hypothetical protein